MVRGGSTKKTLGFELPTPVDAPRLDLRERSRVSDRSVEPPAATPTRDRFEPTRAAPYLLTRGRGRCGRKLVLMPDEKPLRDLPGYALRVVVPAIPRASRSAVGRRRCLARSPSPPRSSSQRRIELRSKRRSHHFFPPHSGPRRPTQAPFRVCRQLR